MPCQSCQDPARCDRAGLCQCFRAQLPAGQQAACKCIFCARDILEGGECQSGDQAERYDRLAAGVAGTQGDKNG